MTEIDIILLFFATVLGAITTSGLGWLDSNTPFNARQFVPGLLRGIIAAIIVFIAQYEGYIGTVTIFTYLGAFLAGGGFDTIANRAAGILGISQGTTTSPPATPPTPPTSPAKNYTKLFKQIRRLMFLQYLK